MRTPRYLVIACAAAALGSAIAQAGTARLYSWETGLEDWTPVAPTVFANSTTLGVTHGTQSLLIDNLASGFKNVGAVTHGAGAGGATYAKWKAAAARIAAGDTDVRLEFDFTYDNANATNLPQFGQLGLFVNSTGTGFKGYGTGAFIGGNVGADFPVLVGAAVTEGATMTGAGITRHLSVPLGGPGKTLSIGNDPASFYQVGFQSNGSWGGAVDWAIDNMKLTGANIVPEPATLALLGLGLALCRAGWRRGRA